MKDRFDYRKAEIDVIAYGGDPDCIWESPANRDQYLRSLGLRPEKYGGGNVSRNKDRHPSAKPNGKSGKKGCYITTACLRAKGLPDDCRELNTLRRFRDGYLRSKVGGEAEIEAYYRLAPEIVEAVDCRPDAQMIWNSVYSEMIAPCLSLIEADKQEEAFRLYKAQSLRLAETYCHTPV